MKTKNHKLATAVLLGLPLAAYAVITDDGFRAGTSNLVSANGNSIAAGVGNTASAGSIAVGNQTLASGFSAAIGEGNSAMNRSLAVGADSHADGSSAAFGYANEMQGGAYCLLAGFNNYAVNYTYQGQPFPNNRNILLGYANMALGSSDCALIGCENDSVVFNRVCALGESLTATQHNQVILGRFNKPSTAANVVVVGCGTSSQRKNALEVRTDGQIVINQPQGDISMGIYQ